MKLPSSAVITCWAPPISFLLLTATGMAEGQPKGATLPDGSRNPQYKKYAVFEPYAMVVREYFRLYQQYSGNLAQTLHHIHRYGPYYPDPATFLELFVRNGGANWTGWGDADYDRLMAQAAQTADPQTRFACFQQAEAILLEQAPIIPLVFGARTYLIHPAVKGWEPSLIGLYQYKKVYLTP